MLHFWQVFMYPQCPEFDHLSAPLCPSSRSVSLFLVAVNNKCEKAKNVILKKISLQ